MSGQERGGCYAWLASYTERARQIVDTERARQIVASNAEVKSLEEDDARDKLESLYGEVWSTSEMQDAFTVEDFVAPYVVVRRKADGARGTLQFTHRPRFYHSFEVA